MGTYTAIEVLSDITVGDAIAWITLAVAIVTGICTAAIKLYKIVAKTVKVKDENEEWRELVKRHDAQLSEINECLANIKDNLSRTDKRDFKKLRCQIIQISETNINRGHISIRQLKSLEELFEEYEQGYVDVDGNRVHGNGYVATLMCKVRQVPVTGTLDDDDEDKSCDD